MSWSRSLGIAFVLTASAVACSSGGSDTNPKPDGSAGSGGAKSGGSGGTVSGGASSGGTSIGGTSIGGTSIGGMAGSAGLSDAATSDAADSGSCLTGTAVLATVPPGGGSECSFTFGESYTPGSINLLLTPGWGTVCYAGSSSGCGSGASADGWWFVSENEIALCDASCTRFYDQPAGKLTLQFGCATEDCTH